MNAYRIDPVAQTVTLVDYSGDFHHLYELMSDENYEVELVDVVNLYENGDSAFVDDEGLLKPCDHFWKHEQYPEFIAGPGLVLGVDGEGNSIAPLTSIEEVRAAITFYSRTQVIATLTDAE